MSETVCDISIIGAGVVGTAIGVLAARAGYRVVAVASRSDDAAARAADRIDGDVVVCAPAEAASRADLLLLTVPDDTIATVATELAEADAVRPGTVAAHCSGALGSEALAPLAERCDAVVASMHPLQTFPSILVAIDSLPGAYCFCEGDHRAVSVVMQLAGHIGCVPVEIEAERKTLYHAAACMACNYLATLQEAAIATAALAGIGAEPARRALAPLVAATVANVKDMGPQMALTGPIARGDVQTVSQHIRALDAVDTDLAALYRHLGRRTIDLARQGGKIAENIARDLRAALRKPE